MKQISKEIVLRAETKQRQFLENVIAGKESLELLIMPNSKCNLGCTYCAPGGFLTAKLPYKRMPNEIIDKILALAIDFKNRTNGLVNLEGHGFEPMLAGKDFFRNIGKKAKEADINFVIQTNATLIDKEWTKIFKTYDIGVGVSIDGPEDLHNATRPFHSGADSYKAVLRGIKYLREADIPFGIISVLSKLHIKKDVSYWYDWLLENEFYSADFHLPATSSNNAFFKTNKPSVNELTNFVLDLYDLWKTRSDGIVIRPFALFSHSLIDGMPPSGACTLTSGCHRVVGFDFTGNIALCDSNVYSIGNIKDIGCLEELAAHPAMLASHMRPFLIAQNEESCKKCGYFDLCQGGCTHEAMIDTGNTYQKTKFCEVYKSLYSKIETDLLELGKLPAPREERTS
ncbi:MAG: radical SAM protein [DPANN group archaeon]|nr:radical SAM protein [DPANN group archaeon]